MQLSRFVGLRGGVAKGFATPERLTAAEHHLAHVLRCLRANAGVLSLLFSVELADIRRTGEALHHELSNPPTEQRWRDHLWDRTSNWLMSTRVWVRENAPELEEPCLGREGAWMGATRPVPPAVAPPPEAPSAPSTSVVSSGPTPTNQPSPPAPTPTAPGGRSIWPWLLGLTAAAGLGYGIYRVTR